MLFLVFVVGFVVVFVELSQICREVFYKFGLFINYNEMIVYVVYFMLVEGLRLFDLMVFEQNKILIVNQDLFQDQKVLNYVLYFYIFIDFVIFIMNMIDKILFIVGNFKDGFGLYWFLVERIVYVFYMWDLWQKVGFYC